MVHRLESGPITKVDGEDVRLVKTFGQRNLSYQIYFTVVGNNLFSELTTSYCTVIKTFQNYLKVVTVTFTHYRP